MNWTVNKIQLFLTDVKNINGKTSKQTLKKTVLTKSQTVYSTSCSVFWEIDGKIPFPPIN